MNILKFKVKGDKGTVSEVSYIKQAEILWIKEIQGFLERDNRFEGWRRQFDIFIDDQGLMRCGGRISHSQVPYSAKHPILLDANHELTKLIILDSHKRVMHNGVKDTLTDLRGR